MISYYDIATGEIIGDPAMEQTVRPPEPAPAAEARLVEHDAARRDSDQAAGMPADLLLMDAGRFVAGQP